jgi:hypothetical protein
LRGTRRLRQRHRRFRWKRRNINGLALHFPLGHAGRGEYGRGRWRHAVKDRRLRRFRRGTALARRFGLCRRPRRRSDNRCCLRCLRSGLGPHAGGQWYAAEYRGLHDNVCRAANQQQMLELVAADEHEAAALVNGDRFDDPEARRAAAGDPESADHEGAKRPCRTPDKNQDAE